MGVVLETTIKTIDIINILDIAVKFNRQTD